MDSVEGGSLYSPVHLTLTSQYLSTWAGYEFLKLCSNRPYAHFRPKKMDVKFLILQMDIDIHRSRLFLCFFQSHAVTLFIIQEAHTLILLG